MDWSGLLSTIGSLSIGLALFVLGKLSYRLGTITHARPQYRGLYVAALLVWIGGAVRLISVLDQSLIAPDSTFRPLITLLWKGLPALGVTLGVMVAWQYWSWLLAERN